MKTVLITGANRGLGLEHARRFAARGLRVFATARVPALAADLQALAAAHGPAFTLLPYDALDPAAPAQLCRALADTPLDLLLANAGAMGTASQSFGSVDVEAALQLVRINALAPLKLLEALAGNVARSQRKLVALQSSLMGSIGDNHAGGYYGYRVSKGALNMVARGASVELRSRAVIVVALHPGWVRTRMGGEQAPVSVQQSVEGQQSLLDRLRLADSGGFFNYDGTRLPW